MVAQARLPEVASPTSDRRSVLTEALSQLNRTRSKPPAGRMTGRKRPLADDEKTFEDQPQSFKQDEKKAPHKRQHIAPPSPVAGRAGSTSLPSTPASQDRITRVPPGALDEPRRAARPEVHRNAGMPAKYAKLVDMFDALQQTWQVNRSRCKQTTFPEAQRRVQQQTGSNFLMSHLAQLIFIYPDGISLSYAPNRRSSLGGKAEPILIIDMSGPRPSAPAASVATSSPLKQAFTSLGNGGATPSKDKCSLHAAGQIPSQPSQPTLHAKTPIHSAAPTRMPHRTPIASPANPSPGRAHRQEFSNRMRAWLAQSATISGAALAAQASLQSERDAHTLSSLPQGLQALAQQGLLPVSSQRLQALQRQQSVNELSQSPQAVRDRKQAASNAMLPGTFDSLRRIFGRKGSCVRTYDQPRRRSLVIWADTASVGSTTPSIDPEKAPVATPDGGPSTWALLRFTLPTLGVWIIGPILSLIDTAVVGTKSDIELAALGPGTMVCDYNTYIFTFIAAASECPMPPSAPSSPSFSTA
ncbi:hypothetical protein WJX84_001690 [Apatococcus fuscideae]|uniref:CDT1 Geminin-binding domain-containing protein n=1 Tax=Apatococcus fuscideae TaxID=2026836 RepID=A0AAW1SNZ6_9CHLO